MENIYYSCKICGFHGVTTQKTPFFIVTAVKTSNLTFITQFVSMEALMRVNLCFLPSG
jgi:hypothetical protein